MATGLGEENSAYKLTLSRIQFVRMGMKIFTRKSKNVDYVIKWYIDICWLFNAKDILVEEQ